MGFDDSPPTLYLLSNSGVSWLYKDFHRWPKMIEGALFFKALYESGIPKIAIENPVMHKYAKQIIGANFTQSIQPYQFGHPEQKRTCLWLKCLPPLKETKNVYNEMMELPDNQRQRLHYLPPSKDRALLRSKTFSGIAEAFADQWG